MQFLKIVKLLRQHDKVVVLYSLRVSLEAKFVGEELNKLRVVEHSISIRVHHSCFKEMIVMMMMMLDNAVHL